MSDRESGLSARTIARRLSSVSGFYAYLVARVTRRWRRTRCRAGCRRAGGRPASRTFRWCGCRARCRRSRRRPRSTRWSPRCAPSGTGRWCWRCCWAGCAAARCSVCAWATSGSRTGRCSSPRARAAISGWCRSPNRFFAAVGDYLHDERPPQSPRIGCSWCSRARGAASRCPSEGLDEIIAGARRRAGLEHGTCHQLRHTCLTRLREAGMALEAVQAQAGHRSIESTRVYLHLTNDWLAGEYRRAADADRGRPPRPSSSPSRNAPMTAVEPLAGRGPPARVAARVGGARGPGTAAGGHDAPLPDPAGHVPRPRSVEPPTTRCVSWPAGSPTPPTSRVVADISRATSRTTRCGSPPSPAAKGPTLAKNTQRQRLRMIRDLLRAAHRMGLARRPRPEPDPAR